MRFKLWLEANAQFGFEKTPSLASIENDQPIRRFNLEILMDRLSEKTVGLFQPWSRFLNEMHWGDPDQPGTLKLEVDTGWTFYIKKLGIDLEGHPRWLTKKMFQLNRLGHGGYEDSVANEIYQELETFAHGPLERPHRDFDELQNLTLQVTNQLRKVAKPCFLYEGVKRISRDNYQIIFGVGGQGVEAPDHRRIEQNVTELSYDRHAGSIRVTNYNVESPVGGPHSWTIRPSDLDLYFFPSQKWDEISEAVAVHFKYY